MRDQVNTTSHLDDLRECMREHRADAHRVLRAFTSSDQRLWRHSQILDALDSLDGTVASSSMTECLRLAQEAVTDSSWLYLALRPRIARWRFLRINADVLEADEISVSDFLAFKERLADPGSAGDWMLEIDLRPFQHEAPRLREAKSIGRGVQHLNRTLASRLFVSLGKGDEQLLDFLRIHAYRGQQLMLNGAIESVPELRRALRRAVETLDGQPGGDWDSVAPALRALGFEPGWGNTVERVRDTMSLLQDILQAPSPDELERFLARIPMIFAIAVISPHGFFGQAGVLGRPDTGGQIVYILDQVRALEREMRERLGEQGLDIEPDIVVLTRLIPDSDGTTCDQRLEPIQGTSNARILRIPFREASGQVVPQWISRFRVWPYLERFAVDSERELVAEIGAPPDLLIGNYSDGNLVATLLAQRLGVTQCNIAHALEKTKYLYSDLYWRDNEEHYHFSCQFTADLIAMNAADFIITSTYQEIAGTNESIGQYESYGAFTMPGLYRVASGIDVYDPKFNIVSPGADPDTYFSFEERERRFQHLEDELATKIFGKQDGSSRGTLSEPERPLLVTMARLDRIKNLTGLVDWFGQCEELRSEANLVVFAGQLNAGESDDHEERAQIELMHELMDRHGLDEQMRWLGQLERTVGSEMYRVVADRRGAFVQPALFEAFGLTVIEAMSCGLPTFATCFGGPLEIIEDGVSGFHIDPNHGLESARRIAAFLAEAREDPATWKRISDAALRRVSERYTWRLYAERMMTLARVYGFWKYVSDLQRRETQQYLDVLYGLQYRPLAAQIAHS